MTKMKQREGKTKLKVTIDILPMSSKVVKQLPRGEQGKNPRHSLKVLQEESN